MAKGKEAKDAKKAAHKEAKREKQLLKARKRNAKETGHGEDSCDVEELLKQFETRKPTSEKPIGKLVVCQQPSPRSSCSFTALPSGEILMFGGEFYEGSKVTVYNEAYRWNIDRGEWRFVECPLSPKPRCSHQAVFYRDSVFVFGGEFATVDQFHHFRDLWRFDVKSNTWDEVQCTGIGPSARSGHRMVVYKNQLVVFGGFHDAVRETRYFNDVHVLCLQNFKWTRIQVPAHAPSPSPRSGAIMAAYPQGNGIFVCGGYCKLKDTAKGAQGKSLADGWWLDMTQLNASVASKTPAIRMWEKLGRKACFPIGRSGVSTTTHKSLVICFGGVYDEDDGGTSLRSIFYNDLYAFDLEKRRWLFLRLRGDKVGPQERRLARQHAKEIVPKTAVEGPVTSSSLPTETEDHHCNSNDEDNDSDDDSTFGYIDQDGKLVRIRLETGGHSQAPASTVDNKDPAVSSKKTDIPSVNASSPNIAVGPRSVMSTSTSTVRTLTAPSPRPSEHPPPVPDTSQTTTDSPSTSTLQTDMTTPLPRFNASLVMKDNDLIVYGGLVELGHKELTLDDCWSIHISTLKAWTCRLPGRLDEHPWNEQEEEDDDVDDDDDDDDDASKEHESTGSDGSFMTDSESESEESTGIEDADDRDRVPSVAVQETVRSTRFPLRIAPGSAPFSHETFQALQAKLREAGIDPLRCTCSSTSLREFFDTAKDYWIEEFLRMQQQQPASERQPGTSIATGPSLTNPKEARRGAFALASKRYTEHRPLLQTYATLEKRQGTAENQVGGNS